MKTNKIYRLLSMLLVVAAVFGVFSPAYAFADVIPNSGNDTIKNIIVMIPDGAGFGNFDIAEAVKKSGKGLEGMVTPLTTDTISGKKVEGLYLSDYLVGAAKTYSANSKVTDSAAGGTAIATGYKTKNSSLAITPDGNRSPIASLLEASQIAGKATGLVATKFWFDATPASFASHTTSRTNYEHITWQMLHHNLDVLLGGANGLSYDSKIDPGKIGYTVVRNKTDLQKAVSDGATKVWSSFDNKGTSSIVMDYQGATQPEHPTLLDMTKASIDILSKNVNDSDGFFLMIEGSQIDSGGHSSNAVKVVSEYLAFDEAFAYAVEWAKKDGKTLVVGVPDHDTGGFTPEDEEAVINAISSGKNPDNATWAGNGSHTAQNVPIWAYGPEEALEDLLTEMGLPVKDGKEKTRKGKYYNGVEFNDEYVVENTALAHGVAAVAGLDLDEATKELFVDVTDKGRYKNDTFIMNSGVKIPANVNYYYLNDGTKVDFKYGVSIYTGGRFYIPKHVLEAVGEWNNPFTDVSKDDSFYDAVAFVHANKLFNGTEKGFEPQLPMTRAMYVTVLGRLDEADISDFTVSTFPDVNNGEWYTEYVGWAHSNKIVIGEDSGNFMPENNITREQMMQIIYNYAKHLDENIDKDIEETASLEYADADKISDWAHDAVVYCTAKELVSADADGKIRPTEQATRADVALLMKNFVKKVFDVNEDAAVAIVPGTGDGMTFEEIIGDTENWISTSGEKGLTIKDNYISTTDGNIGYIGKTFRDFKMTFDMKIEGYKSNTYPSLTIRNNNGVKDYTNGYTFIFRDNCIELQKYGAGITQKWLFVGTPEKVTGVFGPAAQTTAFKMDEWNKVTVSATNEDECVRIYLEVNGEVVYDYLDTSSTIQRSGHIGFCKNNAESIQIRAAQ